MNCTQHLHYLDTVKDSIGLLDDKSCNFGYAALNTDVFNPVGIYTQTNGIPVIFNSECTVVVIPHATDFVNKITPVNRLMNGLVTTEKVIGEEMINWNFRDNYKVFQRIDVKVYQVPLSKVRVFNPQQYFHQ